MRLQELFLLGAAVLTVVGIIMVIVKFFTREGFYLETTQPGQILATCQPVATGAAAGTTTGAATGAAPAVTATIPSVTATGAATSAAAPAATSVATGATPIDTPASNNPLIDQAIKASRHMNAASNGVVSGVIQPKPTTQIGLFGMQPISTQQVADLAGTQAISSVQNRTTSTDSMPSPFAPITGSLMGATMGPSSCKDSSMNSCNNCGGDDDYSCNSGL